MATAVALAPEAPVLDVVPKLEDAPANGFLNYSDGKRQAMVENFYRLNHSLQTFDFVQEMKTKYCGLNHRELSIWDAVKYADLVDDSDPDFDSAQLIHLLQTSESLRRAYPGEQYDWLHLVGFVHDLGKMLAHPEGFNEPQWCVVGDTLPVGCAFSEDNVFPQFFRLNPDTQNPRYNTRLGVYTEGIGLDNVNFTFGHDEYMYQVCVGNKCTLPVEALYIIRYHSFYAWHTKGAYDYLCNDQDRAMLKWVRAFQAYDLYSKGGEKVDIEAVLPYYKGLVAKYFPAVLRW